MPNNGKIFVSFGDGDRALDVKCVLTFEDAARDFRFSLSTLLTVDSVTSDAASDWKLVRQWQPQWQHASNEFEVTSKTPMQKIIIRYHGKIQGHCNIIEDRRIALSSYSAWMLSELSVPVSLLCKIENMEDYFILNARYDAAEKLWIYGETEHDPGNIIALKKGQYYAANTDNFNFYYLNPAEKAYADSYVFYYTDIMKYYTSIFPKKEINKMDIVSLDMPSSNMAYFRKELVVIDKINVSADKDKIRQSVISLLAHELGHNWFTGADTTSWEDWLNETGAEWAARLYMLSINDQALFSGNLLWVRDNYKNTPVIKSPDLKRPADGVHFRGTMLFYELYNHYGAETIKTLLQTLANLNDKTTANLLSQLRQTLDQTIPDLIERGLTTKDYSELFQ